MNYPFKRSVQLFLFKRRWRKENTHNQTIPANLFPREKVIVGKHSYGVILAYCYSKTSIGFLNIGNFVSIAPGVTFVLDGNHFINGISTFPFKSKFTGKNDLDASSKGAIILEDEVWIGTNALIMSGVKIGKGSVVAAGSVVVKDVEPYSIVGGNPAKYIKYRVPEEIIPFLLQKNLSKLDESKIISNIDLFYETPTKEIIQKIFGKEKNDKS